MSASKETRYSHNKFRKALLFLLFLWFLYGYVMIFYGLLDILQSGIPPLIYDEGSITFALFVLAFLVLWILFYTLFPIMLGIGLPDVRVTEEGLFVQVFFFWWVFIPWTDILEIKTRFEKSILRKEATVILVRKLTPFHRLIGLGIGSTKPAFQINRSISHYDELIDLIQGKGGQTSR